MSVTTMKKLDTVEVSVPKGTVVDLEVTMYKSSDGSIHSKYSDAQKTQIAINHNDSITKLAAKLYPSARMQALIKKAILTWEFSKLEGESNQPELPVE